MSWVAVAIGGSALVGGLLQSNAANRASDAQANAAAQSNATNWNIYQQQRTDQQPWMQRGNAAGNQLAYLMGLPGYGPGAQFGGQGGYGGYNPGQQTDPSGRSYGQRKPQDLAGVVEDENGRLTRPQDDFGGYPTGGLDPVNQQPNYNTAMGDYGSLSRKFGAQDFQVDPGYQFRLSEGAKALERSAAARGMSASGAQLKALTQYNQGFASNEYGNAYNRYNNDQTTLYNRLAGISGTGQQSANALNQAGSNYAANFGNNTMGAANAYGASQMAGANAWSGALNNMANNWMQYKMWGS